MGEKRAVFFDLYGTLLHFDYGVLGRVELDGREVPSTMPAVHASLRHCFEVDFSVEALQRAALEARRELKSMWGPEHREFSTFERFRLIARALELGEAAIEEMVRVHMDEMFRMMYRPASTLPVLEALSDRPLFLASNFDHAATARRALAEFELDGHFTGIYISDELGWRKPGARFFTEISRRSGVEPGRAFFVGDDPGADIEGAAAAGFRTVWLRPREPYKEPSRGPHHEIERLEQFLELLG